jgi:hypothetical protein
MAKCHFIDVANDPMEHLASALAEPLPMSKEWDVDDSAAFAMELLDQWRHQVADMRR